MNIQFTKKEIKNSVECQWRMYHIKQLLIIYLIIGIISLFFTFITVGKYGSDYLGTALITWLWCIFGSGIIFGCFILYHFSKYRYFINNYKNFKCYEVLLDTLSTSYAYKSSVYYSVSINYDGRNKKIDTNPYFSSTFFSKFSPDDYNNKKVIGLYDNTLEKFYIIKKAD